MAHWPLILLLAASAQAAPRASSDFAAQRAADFLRSIPEDKMTARVDDLVDRLDDQPAEKVLADWLQTGPKDDAEAALIMIAAHPDEFHDEEPRLAAAMASYDPMARRTFWVVVRALQRSEEAKLAWQKLRRKLPTGRLAAFGHAPAAPEGLEKLLQEDPLGALQARLLKEDDTAQREVFFAKHAAMIAKLRALEADQREKLGVDTPEKLAASAKLLGVSTDELQRYWQDALKVGESSERMMASVRAEGQRLLHASPIRVIRPDRLPAAIEKGPAIVIYSGEKCSGCDVVRPTLAKLSRFFAPWHLYYSDNPRLRKQQEIGWVPQLVGYFNGSRIHALAAAATTRELWELLEFIATQGPKHSGLGVVTKTGEGLKIVPAANAKEINAIFHGMF